MTWKSPGDRRDSHGVVATPQSSQPLCSDPLDGLGGEAADHLADEKSLGLLQSLGARVPSSPTSPFIGFQPAHGRAPMNLSGSAGLPVMKYTTSMLVFTALPS